MHGNETSILVDSNPKVLGDGKNMQSVYLSIKQDFSYKNLHRIFYLQRDVIFPLPTIVYPSTATSASRQDLDRDASLSE